jgi:hypothetical protein
MQETPPFVSAPSTPAVASAAFKAHQARRRSSSRSNNKTRSISQTSNGSTKKLNKSSATLRVPRSHSNPPFQISLNLVMKVQAMNGDGKEEFTMEPLELSLNDVNVLPKKDAQQSSLEQKRNNVSGLSTIKSRTPSLNHSSFLRKSRGSSGNESPATVVASFQPQQLPLSQPLQRSSLAEQRKNTPEQSTGSSKKKYANKRSIAKYSCLKNGETTAPMGGSFLASRKNSESELDNGKTLPPRRLTFDNFHEVENRATPKSFGSTFLQSRSYPGDDTCPPRRLNFDDTLQDASNVENGVTTPKSTGSTFLQSKVYPESQLPGDKTYPPVRLNFDDDALSSSSGVENGGGSTTSITESSASQQSVAFSDVSPKAVACTAMDITHLSKNPSSNIPCFHQRQMRIGFIANGVPMAINVALNIRTAEDILDIEPIELLFEGQKMWRRSGRQVTKEMEERNAATTQKRIEHFTKEMEERNAATTQKQIEHLNASTATAKSLSAKKKAIITPKSALNYKKKIPVTK